MFPMFVCVSSTCVRQPIRDVHVVGHRRLLGPPPGLCFLLSPPGAGLAAPYGQAVWDLHVVVDGLGEAPVPAWNVHGLRQVRGEGCHVGVSGS